MKRWLEEGTVIGGAAAGRMTAWDSKWQIYKTDRSSYILAVSRDLAAMWSDFPEAQGLFSDYGDGSVLTLTASPDTLISSMKKGPFPHSREQVENFGDACLRFREAHPFEAITGGLFIEERCLILPADDTASIEDDPVTAGRWLTGGVNIPVTDTAGVHRLASWFPESVISRIASNLGAGPDGKRDKESGSRAVRERPGVQRELTPEVSGGPGEYNKSQRREMPDEPFRLPGSSKLEHFFNEEIVEIVRHADEYRRMGIGFPGAVILYGPPGTGKTFAVEKLTEYLGWPRYDINSDTIGSTYIHETGMKIARMFDMAISNAPSVLVIDEMESFLSVRAGQHQHHVEEVSEFLRKIPEAVSNNVLIFAMTNVLDEIDPAVIRRGRFDHMIEVGFADRYDIRCLLEERRKQIPIDDRANLDWLSAKLEGHPMSDVAFVLREAGRYAVKNRQNTITDDAFRDALSKLPGEVKKARTIGFSV